MKTALVIVGLLALLGVTIGAANGWDRDGFSWLAGDDPWHRVHSNSGMRIDGPNVL
jgi:hypothetical protein